MELNKVIQGDCVQWLGQQSKPFADLIFADPPFNIGYKYDLYEDRKAYEDYYAWTEQWMAGCKGVLKPTGSFWVAIGDDYAAEIRLIGRKLGLHLRNWVIWHYTFGQQTKAKFARSHTHLFYFVNDPKEFTFNDQAVRTFSDRLREYADRRASKDGKMPNDVWSEFPRVCGTFVERVQWHPCQMPESVLSRIIRVSSRPGDVVFDPFSGSGTTLAVAKKLSREFLGTELSASYVAEITDRLAGVSSLAANQVGPGGEWSKDHMQELKAFYMEAAVTTKMLAENPTLMDAFVQQFNWRMEHNGCSRAYSPAEIWDRIEQLRVENGLGRVRIHAIEHRGPRRAFSQQ